MLFNASVFEQSFDNKTLKKGLSLFKQGKVILTHRAPGGDFEFLVGELIRLKLRKRGDRILSFSCSCLQHAFCGHLAALLFYFQKDELGIAARIRPDQKTKTQAVNPERHLTQFLTGLSHRNLPGFLSNFTGNDQNETGVVLPASLANFQRECKTLKQLISPYLEFEGLKQTQLNQIHQRILVKKNALPNNNKNRGFKLDFHLAVLSELPLIFNIRLFGDESGLVALFNESMKSLDDIFRAGITGEAAETWLLATLYAARTKNNTGIDALLFLMPRLLCVVKQRKIFDLLKRLVNKRKGRVLLPGEFDKIMIVRLQLAIREAELFNTPFPFKNYSSTTEFVIARAELKFCGNEINNAVEILEDFYEIVRTERANFFTPYLDFIMQKAQQYGQPLLELKYLEESMVHSLYMSPQQLERFFLLVPTQNRSAEIDRIIARIKSISTEHTLDKISMLLLRDDRPDALVKEIKRHKNKFSLLHKIALRKLPAIKNDFLALYTKHLSEALTDPAYAQYHEQIFLTAKRFLDQLPLAKTRFIVNKTLAHLGAYSHTYKFIRAHFPEE